MISAGIQLSVERCVHYKQTIAISKISLVIHLTNKLSNASSGKFCTLGFTVVLTKWQP